MAPSNTTASGPFATGELSVGIGMKRMCVIVRAVGTMSCFGDEEESGIRKCPFKMITGTNLLPFKPMLPKFRECGFTP